MTNAILFVCPQLELKRDKSGVTLINERRLKFTVTYRLARWRWHRPAACNPVEASDSGPVQALPPRWPEGAMPRGSKSRQRDHRGRPLRTLTAGLHLGGARGDRPVEYF
jgi:hypothetical protein